MSALGRDYRIRAYNTQNQAITVAVLGRRWKFASDGSITDDTESTLLTSVSVAATTGVQVGSNVDNSTNKYLGVNLTVAFTAAVTTDGTGAVSIYLEQSTDAATTWPAVGGAQPPGGIFIGSYTVTAADTTVIQRKNFRIR